MFDYTVAGPVPGNQETVWWQLPVEPLSAGALTPFSFSVLAEIWSRAWYLYYDRVGGEPTLRTPVLRQHLGRAYLNLSVCCRIDVEQLGMDPLAFRINGTRYPLCSREKSGLWGGIKRGRQQRRLNAALSEMATELDQVTARAREWYDKTRELRWTQAEILQVMEEIERIGPDSLAIFFAARHLLAYRYNQLLWATVAQVPFPRNVLLINNAICDLDGLVESELARQMLDLCRQTSKFPDTVAWLRKKDFADWEPKLPDSAVRESIQAFLATFGHRGHHEGELAHPRWQEEAWPLFRNLLACVTRQPKMPPRLPAAQHIQRLLDVTDPGARKQVAQWLAQIRELHRLQSRALHAFAYILAGTRRWALAAGREALADGRLVALDDVFFYELEELKQMMTGEWNISDTHGIQATARMRKEAYDAWQGQEAPEMLLGDVAAMPAHQGLPGVAGHVTGPLRHWEGRQVRGCNAAVICVQQLDSSCALALPVAEGFVSATGTPMDPFVVAARAWHRPMVLSLGSRCRTLMEGAQTTVDGDEILVDQ